MATSSRKRKRTYKTFNQWLKAQPEERHDDLRRQSDRLIRLFREPARDDLHWWHEVGTCLRQLIPTDERTGTRYGTRVRNLLPTWSSRAGTGTN